MVVDLLLLFDATMLIIVSLSVLLGTISSARIFVAPQMHIDLERMYSLMPAQIK